MNIQKCAIVGCGAVGATAAYTLLGSGLFNELILIDINRKKAEGEAMDIGHGVPFIHPVEIYAGTYEGNPKKDGFVNFIIRKNYGMELFDEYDENYVKIKNGKFTFQGLDFIRQ